ncbi:cell division cycle 5 like [Phyllostomus discolor]|uniref:Cell division cycle 5 like n=1 Tax=Phyllostomus discolor TaxID=89673 RepID=A0A834EDR6_9CHIR|nr:cell division cycle 5 like [Phyllostomus discolor]
MRMNLRCFLKLEPAWLIRRERRPRGKQERNSWKRQGVLLPSKREENFGQLA